MAETIRLPLMKNWMLNAKASSEMDEYMNDDLNTAKVLASMFELVPVINSIKDGHIKPEALGSDVLQLLQKQFNISNLFLD